MLYEQETTQYLLRHHPLAGATTISGCIGSRRCLKEKPGGMLQLGIDYYSLTAMDLMLQWTLSIIATITRSYWLFTHLTLPIRFNHLMW
jgi:hypothetical protein